MQGGGPNFGWTFYAPLSTTFAPQSTDYFIFAVSSIRDIFNYGRDQCDRDYF